MTVHVCSFDAVDLTRPRSERGRRRRYLTYEEFRDRVLAAGRDTKWVSDIVEQCQRENVAVFVKQLGANPVQRIMYGPATFDADQAVHLDRLALKDRKGGDIAEWPLELQVREFPPMRRVE